MLQGKTKLLVTNSQSVRPKTNASQLRHMNSWTGPHSPPISAALHQWQWIWTFSTRPMSVVESTHTPRRNMQPTTLRMRCRTFGSGPTRMPL